MINVSVKQAYSDYIAYVDLKFKATTVLCIKRKFKNYILPYFGNLYLCELSFDKYIEWQNIIKQLGFSSSFNSQVQSVFLGFYNYLENVYSIKNHSKILGKMKTDKAEKTKEYNTWTKKEYNQFIKSVDDIVYQTLFEVPFKTGIRKGELLALNFDDFKDNEISINKTITKECFNGKKLITAPKSSKSIRTITIDTNTSRKIKILRLYYKQKYKNVNNDFFIFGGIKPISCTTLERKKNFYCDKANVKRIKIHEFRHSHATMLYDNNVDIKQIQYRLGHASISTTLDVYVHPNKKNELRIIKILNSLY